MSAFPFPDRLGEFFSRVMNIPVPYRNISLQKDSPELIAPRIILKIEIERESDGRWIAEIPDLPGVMAYGDSRSDAVARAETIALRVIADRMEHGETVPELDELFAVPA